MKRLFFTSLITIVSITIIIILIVGVSLSFRYGKVEKQWREEAYNDYISYLSSQLTPEKVIGIKTSPSSLRVNLQSFPNDRITGLFFHSSMNSTSFAIGKTPQGFSIASDLDSAAKQNRALIKISQQEQTEVTDTLFDITFNGSSMSVDTIVDKVQLDFVLPDNLSSNDIAGSATFRINGTVFGSVFVITHTPMTYSYSSAVISGAITVLLWSIPFALIVSLVIAWIYSYKNTKMVSSIKASLQALTNPSHEKLTFPKNSIPFIAQIFDSIGELDDTLSQNQRNRGEWLRTISHDLNTPVASLKITLEGIQDKVFSPDDPKVIATLCEETSVLEKRIQSIIEFSRLQTLKTIDIEEISSESFISEVTNLLPAKFTSNLVITCHADSFRGDRRLLQRACYELLKNCMAADSNGENTIWSIDSDESTIIMKFSNPGKLAGNIDFFEPWSRGDWSREEGGSGMGLPIISRIIALHHGKATLLQNNQDTVTATIFWPL